MKPLQPILQNAPDSHTARPLAGRVAVVTGGASGLGAATVEALRQAGARVGRIDQDGDALRRSAHGTDDLDFALDVADGDAMEQAFDAIAARCGPVFILVNCAGIAAPGSVVRRHEAMPLADFRRVIDINVLGMLNGIRCAVPQMVRAREGEAPAGVIVNTASIAAFEGQVGQAAYAASKGAVAGMVLPLARELGPHGIRVMGIAPGVFETPMTLRLDAKSRDVVFAARPPFPARAGMPDEFAQLVLHIVANPMLNGDVIRLDGGLRMPARL